MISYLKSNNILIDDRPQQLNNSEVLTYPKTKQSINFQVYALKIIFPFFFVFFIVFFFFGGVVCLFFRSGTQTTSEVWSIAIHDTFGINKFVCECVCGLRLKGYK